MIFRVVQGIGGAALVPLAQATLLSINPPEQHGHAMAVFGAGTILGPIAGPALGGWLTDTFGWRSVFYVNVPVGILSALGIAIFFRDNRRAHREAFDFFGFATLSIGIGAFQLMLDRGAVHDWFASPEIWVEATLAGLSLYLFIVHTATTTGHSFISRDLLRNSPFVAGTVRQAHPHIPNHRARALSEINYERLLSAKPGQSNAYMEDTEFGDLTLPCHRKVNTKFRIRCFNDVYTRMRPDFPSPTVTTKCHSVSNGRFGHYDIMQVRGLSLREAAILQSFPENYIFYPDDGIEPVARMIGNAVPPKLAAFFACYLVNSLKPLERARRSSLS